MSVLVIGLNYWGHADDLKTAKANFRKQGGQLSRGYAIVEFAAPLEFAGVSNLDGTVYWNGDGEPAVKQVKARGAWNR